MAIRLVISDFDRTFTDETLDVDTGLANAIRIIKGRGIAFSIVSGRNYDFLLEFCERLDGVVDSFVAENGCIGDFNGKKYFIGRSAYREALLERLDRLRVPYGHGEVIIAVDAPHEKELMEALSGLDDAFDVIKNVDSLMILPHGVSKASGAAWLARMHGVSAGETAAIGDAENDIHLRNACGLLGAVSNAIPELKNTADYVCKHGYGKGLQEFLEYIDKQC
jgi:hydroxymethylpyrimidine pyrophosphatase-like HAD family hydrolase